MEAKNLQTKQIKLFLWNQQYECLDKLHETKSEKPYGRVAILNYYQTQNDLNSITAEVYCNVLGVDKTPHACEYARENLGPKGRRVSLVNRNLLYDQIVMEAHARGWVGTAEDKEDLKVLNWNSVGRGNRKRIT